MKIGTLTFHHTTNYGATLQAYALYKFLERLGHEVEVIDYRPREAAKNYRRELKFINKKFEFKPASFRYWAKYLKMRLFLLSHLCLSRPTTYVSEPLGEMAKRYDAVICGSDQIWCLDSPFRGFNPAFFLDFIGASNPCLKLSYGASFGSTTDLGEHKEIIKRLIQDFDYVGVRDANSARLVQNDCGKLCTKVVDPTFLLGKQEYEQLLVRPKYAKNYLVVYNQGVLGTTERHLIEKIAKIRNLDIISVGLRNNFAVKNITTAGPREWLGYLYDASYVVTNTYHGTIFSMIFEKPFTVLTYRGKNLKTPDLLQSLNLENRIVDGQRGADPGFEAFDGDISYPAVREKLKPQIENSTAFLQDSLAVWPGQ